jgi:hypothetical protein
VCCRTNTDLVRIAQAGEQKPCFACGVFQYSRIPYRGRQQAMSFCGIVPFGKADYLKAFEPYQLHALVKMSLKLHDYGFGIDLVFFGFACLIYGYLLFRSVISPGLLAF